MSPKISTTEKLEWKTCEVPFCNTKECVSVASAMLESMNPDVDPCTDFYNYSCGGYSRKKSVPYAMDLLNPFKEIQEELLIDIRKIIEELPSDADGSAMGKMRKFYETCMNITHRDEAQNKTLSTWFKDLKLVPSNYTMGDPFNFEPPVQWTELVSTLEQYQIHTLFKVNIFPTRKAAPEKLGINCPAPALKPEAFLNTTDTELAFQLATYKESMNAALELLYMDRVTRNEFVEDILKIDVDIAKSISMNEEKRLELTEDQKRVLSGIWRPLVGDALDKMEIIYLCPYEAQSMFSVLYEAPNKRVVRYVMWRMLMQIMQYMGTQFRNLHIHYMTKLPHRRMGLNYMSLVPHNRYAYESRWKECIDIVRTDLGFIAIKGLIDNGHFKKEMVDEVNTKFTDIKKVFNRMLNVSAVDDREAREVKRMKDKWESMKMRTNFLVNMTDSNVLDSLYNELTLDKDHFSNILEIKRFNRRREFLRLYDNSTNEISMESTPLDVSIRYEHESNTIYVDLSVLRPPIFLNSSEVPRYLTYAFSSLLARGLGIAFDSVGRLYDAHGQYDESVLYNFIFCRWLFPSSCLFIEPNYSPYNTNKMVSDMIALDISYELLKAHLKSHSTEKPLPGVNLTAKQTFLVQIAQLYCEIRGKHYYDMFPNLHSNDNRANLAFLHLDDFGSVFNCPIDSPMLKRNKCKEEAKRHVEKLKLDNKCLL